MNRLLKFYRLLPSVRYLLLQHAMPRHSMFTLPKHWYLSGNHCKSRQSFVTCMMSVSTEKCTPGDRGSHLKDSLSTLAEQYTTTLGTYTAWKTDVNLNSPDPNLPLTKDDEHIQDYYNALQYSLFENNLPETIDRSHTPRDHNPDTGVAVVVLSSPVECLAILLEGGKQCPGDMLLVMSPTWLVKEKSDRGEGLHSLFVKKAIVFERGGFSFIDVFNVPRKCTYLINFFTKACTDGQRGDGEPIEIDLDCPMSSSMDLCKRIDDKLLTRIYMAEAGIYYPETLAISYKPANEYKVPNDTRIKVLSLETKDGIEDLIEEELKHFLNSKSIQAVKKVVVKPSGLLWHGSRCVSYHDVTDFSSIFNAAVDLFSILEVENTVLIEAFYHATTSGTNRDLDDYSFRLRSNVCRKFDDTSATTLLVCGIGRKDSPINGDNTIPQSFETTLKMWGLNDHECKEMREKIVKGSERLLDRIIKSERLLSGDLRGGVGAQTDLIGIDFVIGEVNGNLEPVGIEVNSHDCTINCQLFEFINPDRQGEAVKPYVETMIRRSQMFAMQGKTVLVIGAGGYSKRFIWEAYKSFGIQVILVDADETSHASVNSSVFIKYDFVNHKKDQEHAVDIIGILKEKSIVVDGCVTFWEDCGPLAALICDQLNLHGPGQRAAQVAKKKSWTHNVLRKRTGDIPHYPRTVLYAAKCCQIKSEFDIENAINHVGLPAVLKLEYGSSAVGVKPVTDQIVCKNLYQHIKSKLRWEQDHPGIGLGHGNDLLLMEYIDGTEHDVDVIIFQRQLVAAFVSDNGPTREGSFTETTALMPSCLLPDRENQLITAAYQCCTEIGLVDGVFNVEMKMTKTGPKLLEINARMGGFYLRDWILACYGIDILLYSFMCCLGIRPIIAKQRPKYHLMGTMCVPSAHAEQLRDLHQLTALNSMIQSGLVRYNQIEASLEDCGSSDEEEPFCNIAVAGSNTKQVKQKLLNVSAVMGLNTEDYNMNYLLKDFDC